MKSASAQDISGGVVCTIIRCAAEVTRKSSVGYYLQELQQIAGPGKGKGNVGDRSRVRDDRD